MLSNIVGQPAVRHLSAYCSRVRTGAAASKCRFNLNHAKTRMQRATSGRRIITGVAVDDKHVYPTRKHKRLLRAAKHSGNEASESGYREWLALKAPKTFKGVIPRKTRRVSKRAISIGDDE